MFSTVVFREFLKYITQIYLLTHRCACVRARSARDSVFVTFESEFERVMFSDFLCYK